MTYKSIPQITKKQGDRFWERVKKQPNGCWEWQGCNAGRYAQVTLNFEKYAVHRIAYFMYYLEDPKEMYVCHSCDNVLCCNPFHLWLGTNTDNVRDMFSKGRANKAKGSAHGQAKLTEEDIPIIRARSANGESRKAIAQDYGVSRQIIDFACTRRTWKHVL